MVFLDSNQTFTLRFGGRRAGRFPFIPPGRASFRAAAPKRGGVFPTWQPASRVKVIDAKMRLSVQVHPNETTCKLTGGDPKTEMWAMLEDGVIYAGLKPGVGPKDVEEAVKSGRFEELLVRHEAKKGEAFFIPGGLVHAIGDGALIYEVQQSSNTTFRLYDWGRVGADGRARELHVDKALEAIDLALPVPRPVRELDTPYFRFTQVDLDGERTFAAAPGGYLCVFGERTGCVLLADGESETFSAGGEHLMVTEFR